MIKRTFNPAFRIELHQKDLNLALTGRRAEDTRRQSAGTESPQRANRQQRQVFNACAARGGKGWVIRLWCVHSNFLRTTKSAPKPSTRPSSRRNHLIER